jgi:hypothetical protein
MIKYFLILLIVLCTFWSCEDIPNEVIEPLVVKYSVEDISAPNLVIYSENKTITTSIALNNTETIKSVWFDINSFNGSENITSLIEMITDQVTLRKTYTGNVNLDENLLPGNYILNYYVEDNIRPDGENTRKVGSKKFKFQIEANNFPPEISVPIVPAKIPLGSLFKLTVKVVDPNGPDDIKEVYFELFDPQGKIVYSDSANEVSKFPMNDNGQSGDSLPKDGIYSTNFSFPVDAQLGEWNFIITALDESGEVSNSIEKSIEVSQNFPPVISELVMPEEVNRGVQFVFTLAVFDQNGFSDIDIVYFTLIRPDKSIVYFDEENEIKEFPMFDNGDFNGIGDEEAEDGIYSLKNSFGETSQTGDWEFTFNAVDKAGQISNTITKTLKVN